MVIRASIRLSKQTTLSASYTIKGPLFLCLSNLVTLRLGETRAVRGITALSLGRLKVDISVVLQL